MKIKSYFSKQFWGKMISCHCVTKMLLMFLEGLLSALVLSVTQIHTARFVQGLTVTCMEAQQKWVRIPLGNVRHAMHDRSNRIFLFLSCLSISSEII